MLLALAFLALSTLPVQLSSVPVQAVAAGDMSLFQQGVEAYRRGDHHSAESLWRRLVDTGSETIDPAVLYYDLGNAAFRLERPLEAAGWYTAALRLAPRHADAWTNLELARERAGLDPADRGDLVDTLKRLGSALTLAELEWTLVVLAAALLAVLLVEAFRGGLALRRTAWGLGAVALCLALLWVARIASREHAPLFVTETGGAALRSEPRTDAATVGRIDPADVVECLDGMPGWLRVHADGGRVGWVEEGSLLVLPASRATR